MHPTTLPTITPALEITDLVKRYPTGTEALKGVSLRIEDGEFFGLLGPNGAGKSTLIHCTTGLAQPTGGEIRVFGHDAMHHYEQARLAVGLAPQDLNLDWFLTVEQTLDYHGGYFGMPRKDRRERAKELLESFSLTEKRNDRTRTLSGGMKRRLILARALMHRPRLLILDEPTAGLDPAGVEALLTALAGLHAAGTTLVLSTHDVDLAFRWADDVAVVADGTVRVAPAARALADGELLAGAGLTPAWAPLVHRLVESVPGLAGARPRTAAELAALLDRAAAPLAAPAADALAAPAADAGTG